MPALFRKLTYFAAGVDESVIAQCSSRTKNSFSILGTLVYVPLITGMAAMAFACSYATRSVFVTAAVCLLWASVIFVIERALIAGLRPRQWSWAIPARFILALAMSCIITELLLMFAFKPDIEARIASKQAVQTEQIATRSDSRIEELKADLDRRKQILDEKEKAYLDEIDGRNGTGIHGYGPSAKAKELARDQERADYEEAKARIQEEIASQSRQRDEGVSRLERERRVGLLQCMTALYELSSEDRHVTAALWILHIFFLFFEMMPMIIKLSMRETQYYEVGDIIDNQKLEALRLTTEDSQKMMCLASQCEIAQQEVAIQNKMTRLRYQQAADRALIEAKAMYDTALALEEIENRNRGRLSEERAQKLKEETAALFERYLGSRLAEPAAS